MTTYHFHRPKNRNTPDFAHPQPLNTPLTPTANPLKSLALAPLSTRGQRADPLAAPHRPCHPLAAAKASHPARRALTDHRGRTGPDPPPPLRQTPERHHTARYYDPELSLFLQPDWFEVTKAGVGTNRFSYCFNDPVNLSDPNGNIVPVVVAGVCALGGSEAVAAFFVAGAIVVSAKVATDAINEKTMEMVRLLQRAKSSLIQSALGSDITESTSRS